MNGTTPPHSWWLEGFAQCLHPNHGLVQTGLRPAGQADNVEPSRFAAALRGDARASVATLEVK